ncbi:MAG: hypothetical protein NT023_13260 [Armatimonadetes bacterium]|nr:hypothetical protein [Armatimonadota bacterium]
MTTQILEGTFTEVQRQLSALPLKSEARLRIIVTEAEAVDALPAKPFTPTEFRNGLPLLPQRELTEPITLKLVQRLSEDEEAFSAYRTTGR